MTKMTTAPPLYTQPDFDAGDEDSVERFDAAVTGRLPVFTTPDNKRSRVTFDTPQDQSIPVAQSPPPVRRVIQAVGPDTAFLGFRIAKNRVMEDLKTSFILVSEDFPCPGCDLHPLTGDEMFDNRAAFNCKVFKTRVLKAVYLDERFDELVQTIAEEEYDKVKDETSESKDGVPSDT